MGSGRFRRSDDLLIGRFRTSVRNIVTDRSLQEPCLLKHHTESSSQICTRDLPDILPVDQDPSAVRFIEAHQKIHECRLPAAGRSDNGHLLSGLHPETEVIEYLLVFGIAECHVLEEHLSLFSVAGTGCLRILTLLRKIEDREYTGQGSECRHDLRRDIRQIVDRFTEVLPVKDEGRDISDGKTSEPDTQCTDQDICRTVDEPRDRIRKRRRELCRHRGLIELLVLLPEGSEELLLAPESLDLFSSVEVLLHIPGDRTDQILLGLEVFRRFLRNRRRRPNHENSHRQDDQRHFPADIDHEADRSEDRHHHGKEIEKSLKHALRDGIRIINEVCRRVSLRMCIIERHRKTDKFRRECAAYFKCRLGRHHIGEIADDPGKECRHQIHAQEDTCVDTQVGQIHVPGLTHIIDGRA